MVIVEESVTIKIDSKLFSIHRQKSLRSALKVVGSLLNGTWIAFAEMGAKPRKKKSPELEFGAFPQSEPYPGMAVALKLFYRVL